MRAISIALLSLGLCIATGFQSLRAQFASDRFYLGIADGYFFPRAELREKYKSVGRMQEIKAGWIVSNFWTVTVSNQWQQLGAGKVDQIAFNPYSLQIGADFNLNYLVKVMAEPDSSSWLYKTWAPQVVVSASLGTAWAKDTHLLDKDRYMSLMDIAVWFPCLIRFRQTIVNTYGIIAFVNTVLPQDHPPAIIYQGFKIGLAVAFWDKTKTKKRD